MSMSSNRQFGMFPLTDRQDLFLQPVLPLACVLFPHSPSSLPYSPSLRPYSPSRLPGDGLQPYTVNYLSQGVVSATEFSQSDIRHECEL